MIIEMEQKERLDKGLCPHCGTPLENGFGLAGGGFGAYTFCPAETCGKYFNKTQERDERS
jgi:hypothetical protein